MLTARLGWINPSSRRQHRTPWPLPPTSGIRATGPRCNYTNPAELALFPGTLDQITYGIRAAPLGAEPESSSASSASSRTGRSASSSCLPNRYGYAIPAIAAPISGASQNTQSCAGAPLPLKNVTPVERAGLTDVVEIGRSGGSG